MNANSVLTDYGHIRPSAKWKCEAFIRKWLRSSRSLIKCGVLLSVRPCAAAHEAVFGA